MTARTLTVSMAALGLDAEQYARVNVKAIVARVIGGVPPEVEVNTDARTDVSGVAIVSLEPSATGTMYEARIFTRAGRKLFEQKFIMPDAAANLHDLPAQGAGALRETSAVSYPARLKVKTIAGREHTLSAEDLEYDLLVFNDAKRCTLYLPHSSELSLPAGICINARNRAGSLAYERTATAIAEGVVIEGSGQIALYTNGATVSTVCYEAPDRFVTVGALHALPVLQSVTLDSVAGTAFWLFGDVFYEPAGDGFSIEGVTISAGTVADDTVEHTAAGLSQGATYTCVFYGQSVTAVAS